MKATELRKLIREEVRKVLTESMDLKAAFEKRKSIAQTQVIPQVQKALEDRFGAGNVVVKPYMHIANVSFSIKGKRNSISIQPRLDEPNKLTFNLNYSVGSSMYEDTEVSTLDEAIKLAIEYLSKK